MFGRMKKYWPVNLVVGCLLAIMAYCLFLPDWKGIFEDSKIFLVFCSAFVVSGSLSTACLCRREARRKQRISYALVLPTAFVVAAFTMLTGSLVVYGPRVFTMEYWRLTLQRWPMTWLALWLLGFVVSLLAVLGIVVYYRRQQRDETLQA
jgi:hypothetical protein